MKKIFTLILLACLGTGWVFSQNIQLIMSPRPSPYFSDWQNKTETARLIVNNPSKASIDCKIKTQLFNSKEEMVGETDFNKMPVLTLMPGISQFNAEDIYPLDAIRLFGNSLSSMLKTGRIPEDNYRLCTDLLDPVKGTPLTQSPQCKMFSIIAFQAPVLLSPREDESIPVARIRGVNFRWSPVTPSANQVVIYRLQIWEVLDGQNKVDACRNNMPVYEKDLRGVLQTGWPVDFVPAEGQKSFVWSITPLDDQDRKLVTEGYGMAEPFGFSLSVIRTVGGDLDLVNKITVSGNTANTPLDLMVVNLSMSSSGTSRTNQFRLEDLNIQLTNNAKEPVEVSLRGTVTLTSNADTPTKAAPRPIRYGLILNFGFKPFTLPPGTTTFTFDDIKKGDLKFSSDEWTKAFGPDGILPPGDYEICAWVLESSESDGYKACIDQKITGGGPRTIELLSPKGDLPPTSNSPTFIFRPSTSTWKTEKAEEGVSYSIVVREIPEAGEPENGVMVLERSNIRENTLPFPKNTPSLDVAKSYAWQLSWFKNGKLEGRTPFTLFNFHKETNSQKRKFAFRWNTDYRIERSDLLKYLKTEELVIKQGDYPYDYSSNPYGNVTLRLAKPLPAQGIDEKGIMSNADCMDPSCLEDGESCYRAFGGIMNCLVTPVIENGLIIKLILSYKGDNSGSGSTGGGSGTIRLLSPVGHGGTGDEGSGEEGDLVTFKWSAPDLKGPFSLHIVELKESQSPDEAMQKNKAFFEQNGIEGTTFKYPGLAPKFESGKKYAWMIQYGELRSSISIYDRWGIKIAYSWETDYHLDNADILGYLQTDEVIIKKGKYLFDYSTNPNGDVTLPLTKPIRDNRINKAEVMFEGVPADIDCAKDGSSCVGGPRPLSMGKPSYYIVKPGIANGMIFQIILSYKAANSGQNDHSGDPAVGVKINPPAPNQLKLTDLTNFTLTNGILKPLEVVLSCTLTSAKTQPLLIIIIIVLKKFTLPPGPTTFTPDDFKSGDVKFASDEWAKAFGPNGKVPAGDYTLCVSVQDQSGKEIRKGCIEQKIVGGDAPQLISPKDDLPPTSNRPTFEWKMEPALENVSYSITVKELEEGKDIENGVMVLERSNIRENTLPFPQNTPSLDPAKSYGWKVSWFKNGRLMGRTSFTRFSFTKGTGGGTPLQCECGKWGPLEINKVKVDCGGKMESKCSEPINFKNTYQCTPNNENCKAKTKWDIMLNSISIQSGIGSSGTFTPVTDGTYVITLNASCNGVSCPPCTYTIMVKGCPCQCNEKWGPLEINKVKVDCGGKMESKCSQPISFKNTYQCIPLNENCKAKTKWDIMLNNTSIQSGVGSSGTFTPVTNGTYVITLNASCNGVSCPPCTYTIVVKDCKSGSGGGGPRKIELLSPIGLVTPTGNFGPLTFKWNDTKPTGPYSLKIFEINDRQSTEAAIKENKTFFEQNNIEGTTFLYPESAKNFEKGKKYAWRIETNDKALSSSDPGDFTLSTCAPVFTCTIQCVGNDLYNFTITCQNAADPITDPTCVLDLTSVTAVAASFPVSLTTTLPLSIPAGQTVSINGQIGPMLPSSILMFIFTFPVQNSPPVTYAHTFTLPLPPATPGAITGATSVCQGQTGVVYSISTVTDATSYLWTVPTGASIINGAGTPSITVIFGSSAGNVCVSASNLCGSSTTSCKTITINPPPAQPGAITGNATPCVGSSQAYSITNVPGVTYSWAFPAGWTPAGGTTNSVTKTVGTGSGNITVTPANACGNGLARTFAVSPMTLPAQPGIIAGSATPCQGSSQIYSVANVPGVTYTWTFPAGWTPAGGTTNSVTKTVGPNSGNITVTPSNSCGNGPAQTLAVTIQVPPAYPDAISGTATVCAGTSGLVYNISPVSGATSYTWTVPAGWNITNGGNTNTMTATASTSAQNGNITLFVNNSCGGSNETLAVTIQAIPTTPGAITGSATPCQGSSQNYSVTNVPGVTYTWTFPVGWTPAGGTTNSVTKTVGAGSGNISVTPSNACGSGPAQIFAVTPMAVPGQPGAIAGSAIPCMGSSQIYSVTNVPGVTYIWTFPAGWTPAGGTANSATVTIGTGPGNITVAASNACGTGPVRTLAVVPITIPAQPGAITGNATPCLGSSQNYSVANVPGVTYTWTFPAGWTPTGGTTNSVTKTVGPNAGNITVTPSNSCGSGPARTIAVTPMTLPAQPSAIAGNATPCQGSSQNYNVTNVPGVTYTWTFPAGWTPAGGTTNSVTKTAGAGSGNITVTPSNACGNGPARTFAVTPTALPTQPGAITGPANVCEGQPGVVYSIAPVNGATSYNWSVPSGATIVLGQGNTIITVTFGILSASGDLCVKAINSCGESAVKCKAITIRSIPEIKGEITGPASVCAGQTGVVYSISAPGGASYSWSSLGAGTITAGQGTTSVTVNFSNSLGSVTLCLTASNICGTSAQKCKSITIITVPPAPVATAATDNFMQPNQFTANWNAVAGASGYIVEISTNPGFNISSDTRIVGPVTSYLVTGLTSNATCPKYYYRVTAMNNCGTSGVSNVIPVATFQTPHGSWTQGPGYSSFTISSYGSTANIVGCPGQSISITMEVWGGGGGGEGGAHGGTGSWFLNGQGGPGGGGGAGGGYKKIIITAIIPSTGTKTYYVFVGSGGLGDVVNSTNATAGEHSEVNPNASYLFSSIILLAAGGNPGTSYSTGGIGGIGGGQSGGDGGSVQACNGGAGGLGGAGGGPGNINHGGNGGHGGYYRHALFPTCIDHDQDYLWSAGENGGNGKVVFTW